MFVQNVYIVGLGALGTMYGAHILEHQKDERVRLRVIVDAKRKEQYSTKGVFCNGKEIKFDYITPEEKREENAKAAAGEKKECSEEGLSLVLICTKFNHLEAVLEELLPPFVEGAGDSIVFSSVLNGVSSEETIARKYGKEKVIYTMAQAVSERYEKSAANGKPEEKAEEEGKEQKKEEGYHVNYSYAGRLHIGEVDGTESERVRYIHDFLLSSNIECVIQSKIKRVMWSKFMFNCGCNQVLGIFLGCYGDLQGDHTYNLEPSYIQSILDKLPCEITALEQLKKEESAVVRDLYMATMLEVLAVSQHEPLFEQLHEEDGSAPGESEKMKETISLNQEDVESWEKVTAGLVATFAPSTKLDLAARRPSEVDIFAGKVIELGEKYGVATPVNAKLYEIIKTIEKTY